MLLLHSRMLMILMMVLHRCVDYVDVVVVASVVADVVCDV